MTSSDNQPVRDIAKLGAVALAILYGFGFIVVSVRLSQFNVAAYGMLRIQYLLAGIWLLLPMIAVLLPLVWTAAFLHDEYRAGKLPLSWSRRLLGHMYKIAKAITLSFMMLTTIAGIFAASVPEIRVHLGMPDAKFIFRYIGTVLLFALGIGLTAFVAWLFGRDVKRRALTESLNDTLWSGIGGSLCVAISLAYICHFALTLYPRIPASLGGGEPVRVSLVYKEHSIDNRPNDSKTSTAAYDLILDAEDEYVVLKPGGDEIILRIRKDELRGAIITNRDRMPIKPERPNLPVNLSRGCFRGPAGSIPPKAARRAASRCGRG